MTTAKYIQWTVCTIAVFAAVQIIDNPLRMKHSKLVYTLSFVIKFLLASAAAFCAMAISNKIIWNLGYLPCALYIVLFSDAFADLAALLCSLIRKKPVSTYTVIWISLVLTAVYFIYGTVNMNTIRAKEHTYTSSKLKNAYTAVFLSDLHYGNPQSRETVQKALDEINALKPDFVVLGGDITDDRTTAEQMNEIYTMFGKLDMPVYYIYGNHDRQSHAHFLGGAKYTRDELKKTITDNGLTILCDDAVLFADDLVIIGREDVEEWENRSKADDLPKLSEEAYVLCVDHNPFHLEEILALAPDLQLSGHTHAGQFFPLHFIYMLGKDVVYGDYHVDDTDIYVSSGIAGWYFPYRTEAQCNYEIIHLNPAE